MSFPSAPRTMKDALQWCEKIADVVNNILQGRTNNYATITLTANAASTVFTLPRGRLSDNSTILWEPTTANASAEIGAGTIYESARAVRATATTSTFTLTHANNANADRTFRIAIIG